MIPFLPLEASRHFSDAIAIRDASGELSYVDLWMYINRIAAKLMEMGVQTDHHVALRISSCREYIVLLWALMRLKAVAVPLNDRLPLTAIEEQLLTASCTKIISQQNPFSMQKGKQWISVQECFLGHLSLEDSFSEIDADLPVTLILTSGSSSGVQSAAVLTYGNHYYNALGSNQNIRLQSGQSWLLSLPLCHVSGLSILFRTAQAGATLLLPDDGFTFKDNILSKMPTHISLVAAQLQNLLEDDAVADYLRGMKAILLGGSAIPKQLVERAYRLGLAIYISYGSTEMASQICTTEPNADLVSLLSSGRVLEHRQVKISEEGQVLVKGKTLFAGYWDKGEIRRPFDDEGWFASGDLGFFDAQKRLHISGRRDRMFISGGENIQPEEIERVLENIPKIKRAVVVGVSDDRFGKRPFAFVQWVGENALDEVQLQKILSSTLPSYKIPLRFVTWPSTIDNGIKVDVKRLEKQAEQMVKNMEKIP